MACTASTVECNGTPSGKEEPLGIELIPLFNKGSGTGLPIKYSKAGHSCRPGLKMILEFPGFSVSKKA